MKFERDGTSFFTGVDVAEDSSKNQGEGENNNASEEDFKNNGRKKRFFCRFSGANGG